MPSVDPIDIAILIAFFFITLGVGLSHGREAKTIKDFALGGKNFSTATLPLKANIVATYFDNICYVGVKW